MANVSEPTFAISASVIASVTGSSSAKRVPPPFSVSRREPAGELVHRGLHHAHAHAASAGAIGFVSGREARRAEQRQDRRGVRRARGTARPRGTGAGNHGLRVDAAAIVGDVDADDVAGGSRRQHDGALGPLAGGETLFDRFDPVADRVAHQVQHRVHHPLDQELVDLGALALELDAHALAALAREIADHERHPAEDLADRHQPHPHDALRAASGADGRCAIAFS